MTGPIRVTISGPISVTIHQEDPALMSTVADIHTGLQQLVTHAQTVDDKLTTIGQLIQDLKVQVASGGVATQADLDAIMAEVQAAQAPVTEAESKEDTLLTPPPPPTV